MNDGGRWLCPQAGGAWILTGWIVGTLWVCLAAFTGYAAVWWPSHDILKNTAGNWIVGMIALTLIFAAPVGIAWLVVRSVRWRVDAYGIAIFRGTTLRRSLDWSEVYALQVFKATARAWPHGSSKPCSLYFVGPTDIRWLTEFAADRPGPA